MSRSGKVSRTFEFLRVFGAAEKNKEKVEANCTGFSAEFFGSQSVEIFSFARKTKIQMLTTSSRSLTRIHQYLLKILRTLKVRYFIDLKKSQDYVYLIT